MSYGGYSHGTTRERTEQDLRARRPFRRRGYGMSAIEGSVGSGPWAPFGRLPEEYIAQYQVDEPVYTVLSYKTPIAWVASSGLVRIPPVKYSPTTTQHQHACRFYLAGERG